MRGYIRKNGFLVRDNKAKLPYGSCKVRDVAFAFRMGAGFAGAVNTTHPATVRGFLKDPTNPPTFFGQPVMINPTTNAVRAVLDSDRTGNATDVFGVVVRPYPFLGATPPTGNYAGQTGFGTGQLPDGAVDILLSGFIMVPVVGTPSNGSEAYIWTAVASGNHITGGWEAASPSGSGFGVTWDKTQFASPSDSNGICEMRFNV